MTVSYKKSGIGGAAYYTDCMTEDGSKAVDDYYTGSAKEPPGEWYCSPGAGGERASGLGVSDGVRFASIAGNEDIERFHSLINGFHPENGIGLVQNAGSPDRTALHDFTLSAPKSVSVVWSQAPDAIKRQIEAAQRNAARQFLDYMGDRAYTRVGKGGVEKLKGALRGALFGHGSSRADDPQLHTHCVMSNVVECTNGRTGALEAKEMLRWMGAAATRYHASLAWSMREIGFDVEQREKLFEVSGVPELAMEGFSQRRGEIVAETEKRLSALGMSPDAIKASRKFMAVVTAETRTAKNEKTREELQSEWVARGKEYGFTSEQVLELMRVSEAEFIPLTDDQLLQLATEAVDELLEHHSVFGEPALETAVGVRLSTLAPPHQIDRAVALVKERHLLAARAPKRHGGDFRVEASDDVFTTREMLAIEFEMLRAAQRKDGKHVLPTVDLPDSLDPEQRAAAVAACTDMNAVTVIEGTAGAGKSFTMASVAKAYEANGYRVEGLATGWAQAMNLKEAANLSDAKAVTGWLAAIERGEVELNAKTMVILDEVGLTGARDMKRILCKARDAGAKVILVGDTLQQKAVAAGDPLRQISSRIGTNRIDNIRRQKNAEHRAAVMKFLSGNASEGLKVYQDDGAVHVRGSAMEVHNQIAEDWMKTFTSNPDASRLIVVVDNGSRVDLNRLVHERLAAAGALGKSTLLHTEDCKDEGEAIEFSVGDQVIFRVNNIERGAVKNKGGTITDINDFLITLRNEDGEDVVMNVNDKAWHSDEGKLGLRHAYAVTAFSSQGATVDHTFIKDGAGLHRQSAYVAMSRHRETCNVYVDRAARHELKMRQTMADDWRPLAEYGDHDCIDDMTTAWSRESKKTAALDYNDWREATGATASAEVEARYLAHRDAYEKALVEIDRIRQDSKEGAIELKVLPFQEAETYRLDEIKQELEALKIGAQRLLDDQIGQEVIKEAVSDGFIQFDSEGNAIFGGRRPGDHALVNLASDDMVGKRQPVLRDRFAPILKGREDLVDVVNTGREALHLRNLQRTIGQPESTIIVTHGKDEALQMPHVREMMAKASNVSRWDIEEWRRDSAEMVHRDRPGPEQVKASRQEVQDAGHGKTSGDAASAEGNATENSKTQEIKREPAVVELNRKAQELQQQQQRELDKSRERVR
jgi:conjugative relaxase-like TrwC/TraI family protein